MRSWDLVFLHNLHHRIYEWLLCYTDTTVVLHSWYWCTNPHLLWKFNQTFLGDASNLAPILSWYPALFFNISRSSHVLLLSKMALLTQNHFQLLANCFHLYNWDIQKILFEFTVTYFVTISFNLSCSDCRWIVDLTYPLIRSVGPSQCTGLVCNISSPAGSVCQLGSFEIMTLSSSGSGRA
jgi:hypothetical protein